MSGYKAGAAAVLTALVIHSASAAPLKVRGEPAKAGGKAFAPKGEGFSVEFPDAPVAHEKTVELSDGGELKLKCFVSEKAGKGVLLVICADIPDEDDDDVLDGAVNGFAEGAGGESPTVKTVVLNGHPGREFEFEIEGGGKFRGRMYLANGRLYQVVAAGPGDYATGDAATKFFKSFKLTGPAGERRD